MLMSPICQSTPSHLNVNGSFQKHGWHDDSETDSIPGYQKYGRDWFAVLTDANRITGHRFQWAVNINATTIWTVDEIKKKKAQLMKNLGRPETAGLSMFWRLQINSENKDLVHFHFVILDGFSDDEQRILEVFKKAAKPLGIKNLRFHVEPVDLPHSYLGYVLKIRPEDRKKIVLWAKGLPRFTKAGVIRYPWPTEWDRLPAVSANQKGGMARRYRKRRNRIARQEEDALSYCITPEYRQHLKTLTGKSDYEIRKEVLKDREFWETQCDSWHSQRPRDTAFLEYLARLNSEIVENARNREAERHQKHHQNLPTGSTTESRTTLLEQPRSVSTTPRDTQHGRTGRETMPVPGSTNYDHLEHSENRRQRRLEPMQPQEARRGRDYHERTLSSPSIEHHFATDVRPPLGCSP
jgi:hypothetical protein